MNQWDNEIADDLANAAEIFEPTDPTATQTPQQQAVPQEQPQGQNAVPAIEAQNHLAWHGVVPQLDSEDDDNDDADLLAAKVLWLKSSPEEFNQADPHDVRALTATVQERWDDFKQLYGSQRLILCIHSMFYALEPFYQSWRSSIQLVNFIYERTAQGEARAALKEYRDYVLDDAQSALRKAAQSFIKAKACWSGLLDELIPEGLSQRDFLVCRFQQVHIRVANPQPGEVLRCQCPGCLQAFRNDRPHLFPALPSQIRCFLSQRPAPLPFTEFYDFVRMDDEEGGDRDYFDLCWVIWNDGAVRSQKAAYAFEQTNLQPLPDFAPNEAV